MQLRARVLAQNDDPRRAADDEPLGAAKTFDRDGLERSGERITRVPLEQELTVYRGVEAVDVGLRANASGSAGTGKCAWRTAAPAWRTDDRTARAVWSGYVGAKSRLDRFASR